MANKFTNPKVWIGTNLDISPYVRSIAIEEEAEELDASNFSDTRAIEYGRHSGTATLAGVWGFDFVNAVSAYVGSTPFAVKVQPIASVSSYLNFTASAGVLPWTEIEADQLGEYSWVLNLRSDVTKS